MSEDVNESIIVGLTLGQADGSGVEVLLKECLQLRLCVILIQTNHLKGIVVEQQLQKKYNSQPLRFKYADHITQKSSITSEKLQPI